MQFCAKLRFDLMKTSFNRHGAGRQGQQGVIMRCFLSSFAADAKNRCCHRWPGSGPGRNQTHFRWTPPQKPPTCFWAGTFNFSGMSHSRTKRGWLLIEKNSRDETSFCVNSMRIQYRNKLIIKLMVKLNKYLILKQSDFFSFAWLI